MGLERAACYVLCPSLSQQPEEALSQPLTAEVLAATEESWQGDTERGHGVRASTRGTGAVEFCRGL